MPTGGYYRTTRTHVATNFVLWYSLTVIFIDAYRKINISESVRPGSSYNFNDFFAPLYIIYILYVHHFSKCISRGENPTKKVRKFAIIGCVSDESKKKITFHCPRRCGRHVIPIDASQLEEILRNRSYTLREFCINHRFPETNIFSFQFVETSAQTFKNVRSDRLFI